MKFSTNQLKKLFSYGEQLHPSRDWIMLLVLAAGAIAISILWNVWLFSETVSGKQIGAAAVTKQTSVTLMPSDITGVQDVFKQRASEEQNYQKNYKFVDPSIAGR